MENNKEGQVFNNMSKKKKSLKLKIFLVLIVVGIVICGYCWFVKTNNLHKESVKVIERANQYDILVVKLESERDRCEKFITQQEGDFSSFEYCKKFIDWIGGISILK